MSISGDSVQSQGSIKVKALLGRRVLKFIGKEINNWIPGVFTFAVCVTLIAGFRLKRFELISPQYGTGYALGILGTGLMLILFVYSLRKRIPALSIIGSIKLWFFLHMVLGILGPVLILYHANFSLGALNSSVALFTMIIVASSGIIGRFIYGRIHYGLYGGLANLIELQNDFERQKEGLEFEFALIPGVKEELILYAKEIIVPSMVLGESIKRFLSLRWKFKSTFWKIKQISAVYMNQYAIEHKWGFFRKQRMKMQIQRKAKSFLNQAVKVAEFNFYERLFSLWHILHIPLVFILVFAVVVHIIATNRY